MLLNTALLAFLAAPPFTATDMHSLKRLADPQISPDGKWVMYQQTTIELNKSRNTDLFIVPSSGGTPRALTSHPKSDSHGRFSPDGSKIAFISSRDGAPQVFVFDLGGGEPRKVTTLSQGVSNFKWAGNDRLLVATDVDPGCTGPEFDACTKKKADDKPDSIRVYDKLFIRHWDTWEDGLRSHLAIVEVSTGKATDLTPFDADVPPYPGPDDFDVSPDGSEIAFGRNDDRQESTSTNADLFVVSTTGGGVAKKIGSAPGYDGAPHYSPDGSMIAYHAQMRAGFEADRWRLFVYDRKTSTSRNLTEAWDRNVDEIAWSPDSKTIYFTAGDGTANPLFSISASGGAPKKVADGHLTQLSISRDGARAALALDSLSKPADAVIVDLPGGKLTRITQVNDEALAKFALLPPESVTYKGALAKDVQGWITKPANFDASKKYPLVVVVHGGPQSVFGDSWSFRWNPQVFAGAGFVVFQPNPRGSTGFGQQWVDDVSKDWGGKAYEDVMKGTDFAAALPYVDKDRILAAGASYGGYMMNWICTQTKRFKALVSHDGLYNLDSMAATTEEQWFTDWDLGGPPWGKDQTQYLKYSPHRFISQCTTPMLIIHNDKDYRVPVDQGIQLFTALQRQGVPSKLVMFPEENHWVLKAENSVRWYDEVLGWLKKWAN